MTGEALSFCLLADSATMYTAKASRDSIRVETINGTTVIVVLLPWFSAE